MNYQEFKDYILRTLQEQFSKETNITIEQITKNNDVVLDGLTIREDQINISPTIYLNHYYEEYQKGTSLSKILEHILHIYSQYKATDSVDLSFYTDFNSIKSHILFKLIHYKKNEKLLARVPHFKFLDLAVCFYALISKTPMGNATILITNEHMELWKCKKEDLYELSIENTHKILPYKFRNLCDIVSEYITDFDSCNLQDQYGMYVLTNEANTNGASVILYPKLLAELSSHFACDFYILPSSVHEVILLPIHEELNVSHLNSMICEINDTQLTQDEFLSNHAYIYVQKEDTIKIAAC